jgi:hypothetical protein
MQISVDWKTQRRRIGKEGQRENGRRFVYCGTRGCTQCSNPWNASSKNGIYQFEHIRSAFASISASSSLGLRFVLECHVADDRFTTNFRLSRDSLF